uniref:Pleiotropic regulator 1 n=1 Tax=Oncorhynchus tshawytscha TaxID=74940 RepID=A0AAZ3S3C8_ONCTS
MTEDVQKHSVHTLVFRSLKRTHDMFVADHAKPVSLDETSHKVKMAAKLRADYSAVLHMPVLKEGKDRPLGSNMPYFSLQLSGLPGDDPEYLITGTHAYPSGPGVALTADTQIHRNPSEGGVHAMALALPPSQARLDASHTAASVGDIHRHAVGAERPHAPHSHAMSLLEGGGTKNSSLIARKAPTMPKPQWHAPWKLFRVISGHLGWVRSIAVEPGNQWFVTGAGDRTIKIWDLASGKLKLSLTGHISTVRGVAVSTRSPYLFSCGEDKQYPFISALLYMLCLNGLHDSTIRLWDLIAGKTRATLTNHKKSVRALALHPRQYTLASGSADNIKQWTFPDGNFIQNLSGHNAIINAMAVNSDGVLVSGADNGTIHLWDWRTGYNFQRIHAAVQPGSLDSESGIFACMFDNSESRLITAEADKTIKVYKEDDTATEESHPINWKPEILKRKRF